MKSRKATEITKNPEKKNRKKSSGWIKTTAMAIMWLFTACENIPSDQIILNMDEKSEKFSIEYQFGSPESATLVDYNIFVHKNGDNFEWNIEQSDWLISNNIKIESDNVDSLFDEIANKLDHDLITDDTRDDKDDKVAFAKQTYKDSILNRKTPAKEWEIKVKYEKK